MDSYDPERSTLLAICSATSRASVVLQRGHDVVAERFAGEGRHHAEVLLPAIDALLCDAATKLADVDAFAVSIGPGTFTSLRIGLATVKGLAFGGGKPVAPVSTLASVACAAGGEGERVAVLDARRGEWYAAAFDGRSRLDASSLPESVYTTDELAARFPAGARLVGESADALAALLRERGVAIPAGSVREVLPDARAVAALGRELLARGDGIDAAQLVPSYLRRAQAEEDRLSRA